MLIPTCSRRSPSRSKRVYAPNFSLSSQRASRAFTTNQSTQTVYQVRLTAPPFTGSAPSAASAPPGNVERQHVSREGMNSMISSNRRKWLALALLSAVQFMVVLDIAVVNVALPSIQVDLGFSEENLQWVISAYALVFGGFLLLGGRAADLLGRRRIFLVGVVVFTLASLFAGFAWSDVSLISARALQGLGAAVITPAALSILSTTFTEGRERNIALGVWCAVGGFGAAAGVLLGGILTDLLSWSWIFFVNVPVGVTAFVLAPLLLKESRDAQVTRFDVPGAVLVT